MTKKLKQVTVEVQAYELKCQECGSIFYSSNPRMKKCDKCKSNVVHTRCKKYYEEVLKVKRKEAQEARKAKGVKVKCSVCGKTFKAEDRRYSVCPKCKEAKKQRVEAYKQQMQTWARERILKAEANAEKARERAEKARARAKALIAKNTN